MAEFDAGSLSPGQRAALERLLRAGFRFMTLERLERHVALEKDGFAALLDLSGNQVRRFGQIGKLMTQGIGMLVERQGAKMFVCHDETLEAGPELLATYAQIKTELDQLLQDAAGKV